MMARMHRHLLHPPATSSRAQAQAARRKPLDDLDARAIAVAMLQDVELGAALDALLERPEVLQ